MSRSLPHIITVGIIPKLFTTDGYRGYGKLLDRFFPNGFLSFRQIDKGFSLGRDAHIIRVGCHPAYDLRQEMCA